MSTEGIYIFYYFGIFITVNCILYFLLKIRLSLWILVILIVISCILNINLFIYPTFDMSNSILNILSDTVIPVNIPIPIYPANPYLSFIFSFTNSYRQNYDATWLYNDIILEHRMPALTLIESYMKLIIQGEII